MPYSQYRRKGRKPLWIGPAAQAVGMGAAMAARHIGGRLGGRVASAAVRTLGRGNIGAGFRRVGYGVAGAAGAVPAVAYAAGKYGGRRRRSYRKKKSSGTELRKVAVSTYGRKAKSTIQRLMRMTVPARTLLFQGYKLQDNVDINPGLYRMGNQVSSGATSAYVPLFVFCLTSTNQGTTKFSPLRQATIESTGRVSWNSINGLDMTGGFSTFWNCDTNETGSQNSGYFSKLAQLWQSVKLVMYGAKTQQTTYIVELVQPTKDYAAIEDEPELNSMTGTHADRYRDEVYGYWQNKVRPLVTSSIAGTFNSQRQPRKQPYKVLKRWSYVIKPHTSIENDPSANATVAKLFFNDGRILDYEWSKPNGAYDSTNVSATTGIEDRLITPGYINQAVYQASMGTTVQNNPDPRLRKYLIIRAVNTTAVASGSENADNTPSFDLVVRKKELCGPYAT